MSNLTRNRSKLKLTGFTLVELTIVMIIVTLLLSMVGPLAIEQVEKVQVKNEYKTFQRLIKNLSNKAYLTGDSFVLLLTGNKLSIKKAHSDKQILIEYKYLVFKSANLTINTKGYIDPDRLDIYLNNREVHESFSKSINSEFDLSEDK